MSLESWKEEFYEEEFVKERATQQALKKWRGLLPENLAKHNVVYKNKIVADDVCDSGYFAINSHTCSLCYFYIDGEDPCLGCPLCTVNGNVRCDNRNHDGINLYTSDDPIHMIEALEQAVELEKTMFPI